MCWWTNTPTFIYLPTTHMKSRAIWKPHLFHPEHEKAYTPWTGGVTGGETGTYLFLEQIKSKLKKGCVVFWYQEGIFGALNYFPCNPSTSTVLFQSVLNDWNHTPRAGLSLSENIIVNQLPFACPLLFYKDLYWAHSFSLYIIMTHHLFVLQTEIQMYVAVIYAHSGTETPVSTEFTNSMLQLVCMFFTQTCNSCLVLFVYIIRKVTVMESNSNQDVNQWFSYTYCFVFLVTTVKLCQLLSESLTHTGKVVLIWFMDNQFCQH